MESDIKLLHLNTNMGIEGVKDNLSQSLYGFLAFFLARNPESIYQNSNIEAIIEPILKQGGDIVGFSEVFGKVQLEKVKNTLEKKGYKVFFTDAFGMWSQSIEGEHLYNVIGIKNQNLTSEPFITKLYNERKLEAKVFSSYYFLNSFFENGISGNNLENTKNIYSRLSNGILDGAIMSLDLGDFLLSHLHVHPDQKTQPLSSYFKDHVNHEIPHLMIGDFNVGDQKNPDLTNLLSTDFFEGNYKGFMEKGDITYPNSYGLNKLSFAQNTLDNVVGNKGIHNIETSSIDTLSDHKAIKSIIRVK